MPFPLTPEKYAHTRTHTHTHTHAHTRTHTYTAKLLATSAPQTPHPPERLKPCLQLFALVQQPVVEIDQVGQLVHGGGVLCKLLGTARCLCVCACVCMCVCVCVCMCVCMTVCVWPAGPWWWGAVQAVGHCKVCVCVLVCVCVFVCVHVCVHDCVCMASWSVVVGCCASCWALQGVCVLVCVCVFVCVHDCVCMASWSVVVGCCASCWALQGVCLCACVCMCVCVCACVCVHDCVCVYGQLVRGGGVLCKLLGTAKTKQGVCVDV